MPLLSPTLTNILRSAGRGIFAVPRLSSARQQFRQRNFIRLFHASPSVLHGDPSQFKNKPSVSVTFVDKDGKETSVNAKVGMSILEAAHANDVDLEGACEASIACSTCHVILPDEYFDSLPEPSEDEEDMLDMAFGLTATSRLGCQVILDESAEGLRIQLPAATRNFYVDGHKPKPH